MFRSNKAKNILLNIGHRGKATFSTYEYKEFGTLFSVNSFQICFEFLDQSMESPENIIILEQLLRFEEVLTFDDLNKLPFREFENFLRDENSTTCIELKDSPSANKLYGQCKQVLLPAVRIKKSLEVQQQICKSIKEDDYIKSCSKIDKLLMKLFNDNLLNRGYFEVFELDKSSGKLVLLLFVDTPVPPIEMDILKVVIESIEGISQIKMTAG